MESPYRLPQALTGLLVVLCCSVFLSAILPSSQEAVAASWRTAPRAAHGAALAEVAAGRAGAAVQRLRPLAEAHPDDPDFAAVRRDLARITGWFELAERFWDEAIENELRLSLTIRGKELKRVQITGRGEEGVLFLGTNKFGIRTFTTEELDIAELANQLGKASPELRAAPSRRWVQLLVGNPKAERWLKKDKAESTAILRADVALYEDLLQRGTIVLAWENSQKDIDKFGPQHIEASLVQIDAVRTHGHELFAEVEHELRLAAEQLIGRSIDIAGAQALVKGKLKELPDERVRLSYDFQDAAQAEDFVDSPDYLEHIRLRVNPLSGAIREPAFKWVKGALEGKGKGCVRLPFPLEAPVRAEWDIEWRKKGGERNPTAVQMFIGIQDDGNATYAAVMDFGKLEVTHSPTRANQPDWDTQVAIKFRPDKKYHFELSREVDGTTICKIDGQLVNEFVALRQVQRGGAFLWIHSDLPVRVHSFTMEGQFPPRFYKELRGKHIQARMQARGWAPKSD